MSAVLSWEKLAAELAAELGDSIHFDVAHQNARSLLKARVD